MLPLSVYSNKFSLTPVIRNGEISAYLIKYTEEDQLVDSLYLYKFNEKITILECDYSNKELVILYNTNGTSSLTKGLTFNLERYIFMDQKIVRQSFFIIPKYFIKPYEIRLKNGILNLRMNSTLKEYIISEYDSFNKLGVDVCEEIIFYRKNIKAE